MSYDAVDPMLVDAWGGSGGQEWNYKFNGPIKEIVINHADIIDSIMFTTINEGGGTIDSPRFGGNGGRRDKVHIYSRNFHTNNQTDLLFNYFFLSKYRVNISMITQL